VNPKRSLPLLAVVGLLAPPVLGFLHPRAQVARPLTDDEKPTLTKVYVNMPSLPVSTLTSVATDVVRGRVVDMRGVIPETGIAYTEVYLDVSWALKGMSQNHLTVHVPGVADKLNPTIVERAPKLSVGDDVLLFLLLDDESGAIGIFGLDEGVYRITKDRWGRELVNGKEAQGLEISAFIDRLGK